MNSHETLERLDDMVDGELLELELTGNPDTTPDDAWRVMRLKTGSLFGEACYLGGLVAGMDLNRE